MNEAIKEKKNKGWPTKWVWCSLANRDKKIKSGMRYWEEEGMGL